MMNIILIIAGVLVMLGAFSMLPPIGILKKYHPHVKKYEELARVDDIELEAFNTRLFGKILCIVSMVVGLGVLYAGFHGENILWGLLTLVAAIFIAAWWVGWAITYKNCKDHEVVLKQVQAVRVP